MKRHPRSSGVRAAPRCAARPERSRTAQQRLINHSALPRDGGPRRLPPIPAPLPQKQPLPCTGFKGFCACACVCFSISPPSRCCFLCVCAQERGGFFLFPGKHLAPGLGSCEKQVWERRTDGRSKGEPGEPAVIATRLGGLWKGEGEGLGGAEAAAVLTSQK